MAEKDLISDLIVTDTARAYLAHQRGEINQYAQEEGYDEIYRQSLLRDYHEIAPALPDCLAPVVLDIGSGVGGIDVVLDRHYQRAAGGAGAYKGSAPAFWLIDGVLDKPEPSKSSQTHSNQQVALAFLYANGMRQGRYLPPSQLSALRGPFDLVISLRAWCFHIPPAEYLSQVLRLTHQGSVVMVDVRRNKPAWLDVLSTTLCPISKLAETSKSLRMAFRRRRDV